MGYSQAKEALLEAVSLRDTPVVAVYGKWGVGKTHLWREVAPVLQKQGITPLYISCLNHSSISTLRAATFGALLLGQSATGNLVTETVQAIASVVKGRFLKEVQLTSSLSDLQPLMHLLQKRLPPRVVVAFDDIERVLGLISPKELLGFVSFVTSLSGVQAVLMANKTKELLSSEWEELREKAISMELALQTSPDDSIGVGLGELPLQHALVFKERIKSLGIVNVRVVQRIRRVYDAFDATGLVPAEKWELLIPSVVFYVCIVQRAIDNPLTIEEALEPYALKLEDPEKLTESQRAAKQLLNDYRYGHPDDFEIKILAPYLKTGYLDRAALGRYMETVENRRNVGEIDDLLSSTARDALWGSEEPDRAIAKLVNRALPRIGLLDINTASSIAALCGEHGFSALGEVFIERWLGANAALVEAVARKGDLEHRFYVNELHPLLLAEVGRVRARVFPVPSLAEAFNLFAANSEYKYGHIERLTGASVAEYEAHVRGCSSNERALVFELYGKYFAHLGAANERYVVSCRLRAACRAIYLSDPESRLSGIIVREFERLRQRSYLESGEGGGD